MHSHTCKRRKAKLFRTLSKILYICFYTEKIEIMVEFITMSLYKIFTCFIFIIKKYDVHTFVQSIYN